MIYQKKKEFILIIPDPRVFILHSVKKTYSLIKESQKQMETPTTVISTEVEKDSKGFSLKVIKSVVGQESMN